MRVPALSQQQPGREIVEARGASEPVASALDAGALPQDLPGSATTNEKSRNGLSRLMDR